MPTALAASDVPRPRWATRRRRPCAAGGAAGLAAHCHQPLFGPASPRPVLRDRGNAEMDTKSWKLHLRALLDDQCSADHCWTIAAQAYVLALSQRCLVFLHCLLSHPHPAMRSNTLNCALLLIVTAGEAAALACAAWSQARHSGSCHVQPCKQRWCLLSCRRLAASHCGRLGRSIRPGARLVPPIPFLAGAARAASRAQACITPAGHLLDACAPEL